MANWIKFEKATPKKPEIMQMASILGISRADTLLSCIEFWSWADYNLKNGNTHLVDTAMIDEIVGREGFGMALVDVGWLSTVAGTLRISNFERHIGMGAKRRAADAKQKYAKRASSSPI